MKNLKNYIGFINESQKSFTGEYFGKITKASGYNKPQLNKIFKITKITIGSKDKSETEIKNSLSAVTTGHHGSVWVVKTNYSFITKGVQLPGSPPSIILRKGTPIHLDGDGNFSFNVYHFEKDPSKKEIYLTLNTSLSSDNSGQIKVKYTYGKNYFQVVQSTDGSFSNQILGSQFRSTELMNFINLNYGKKITLTPVKGKYKYKSDFILVANQEYSIGIGGSNSQIKNKMDYIAAETIRKQKTPISKDTKNTIDSENQKINSTPGNRKIKLPDLKEENIYIIPGDDIYTYAKIVDEKDPSIVKWYTTKDETYWIHLSLPKWKKAVDILNKMAVPRTPVGESPIVPSVPTTPLIDVISNPPVGVTGGSGVIAPETIPQMTNLKEYYDFLNR